MTEQPDTIDMQEYRFNCAIKWQKHQRETFMLIEALRNDPHSNPKEIKDAQECHKIEHGRAMMHFNEFLRLKAIKIIDGPAW